MATCSPEEVVEDNGPDKIRAKFADSGLSCEKNADEKDEKKLEDDEMSIKSSCSEASPSVDVHKPKDDVLDLSLTAYKELLDEASQPMFKRDSSNPILKKVIDGTNFEDFRAQIGSGKVTFSRKDSRKYWERRTRLDSYGHCVGTSAASRTTQGGSLQNLHGKPEGKKLHKSGSLTTFSAPDSELEGLKYIIFSSPCWDPMKAPSQDEHGETATPPGCAIVSGTSGSPTAVDSSSTKSVCLESVVQSNRESQCPPRLQPVESCYQIAFCDESLTEDRKSVSVSGKRPSNVPRMCDKIVSGSQKVNVEEIEMMDIDCSRSELEDDCLLASSALDSSLPSTASGIRWSSSSIESKVVEVDRTASIPLQWKSQRSSEAVPVSIESLAVVENCKSGRTFAQDDFSVIGMRSADFGIAETSQVLKKTEGGFRSLDENGNPVNHCGMEGPSKSPPFLMSSLCRSDSNRDNRSRIERNDATHPKRRRFNKHFKMNNRQKDINPEEIDGYFGDLDVKDILKRIEDHEDDKLATALGSKKKSSGSQKDREVKATGTRAKKASSNRDMTGRSKLYLEAEAVIRLNGTAKEDSVTNTNKKGSLDVSLMNGDIQISSSKPVAKPMSSFGGESKARDSLISDKITMPGCAESNKDKVGVNGCPDVYSHLLKPNVESSFGSGVVSAKMLSVMCVNMKEDSKSTDGGGTQNPVRGEVMANHVVDGAVTERGNTAVGTNNDSEFGSTPVSSVSSFVVDFYANPADVPAILEDMEFREVKKKKKKRPRSSGAVRNDSAVTHYQRYGGGGGGGSYGGGSGSGGTVNSGSGMVHNGCPDNGGHSASTSWADLPPLPHHHHHRNTRNSDDVRRKSTGSVPPSEHSSADDSDVESVHSLPVSSTTPRPIVNKTSSSSSCTPQASYADIAKMATASFTVGSTVASSSSSRVLGSSYPIKGFVVLREPEDNPKVVLPNPHVSEGQTMNAAALEETKRDASTWTCSDDHQTVNDDSAPLVIVKPLVDTTLKRRIHNPEMFPTLPYEAEDPQKHVLTLSKCDQDSNCHGRESADCSGSGKQVMSSMVEVSGNRMPPHSEVAVTRNSNADPNAVDHNDQVCTIPNLGTPTPVADVIANSSQEVPSTVDVGGRASSGSVTPTDGTNPEKDPNGDGVMSSLPGVVFIGVLDSMDEELTDVTFGFELNEELLRMTTGGPFLGVGDIILRTGSRDDDGAEDTKLQHDIGVGSFEKKGDLEHKRGRTNNLVDSVAEDDDEEERDEDEEETLSALNADHVPVVEVRVPVSSENPYAEGHEELNSDTSGIVIGPSLVKKPWSCRVQQGDELENCNYNYRNVVEYFGKAWNGIQAEFEKECKAGNSGSSSNNNRSARVQYYQRE